MPAELPAIRRAWEHTARYEPRELIGVRSFAERTPAGRFRRHQPVGGPKETGCGASCPSGINGWSGVTGTRSRGGSRVASAGVWRGPLGLLAPAPTRPAALLPPDPRRVCARRRPVVAVVGSGVRAPLARRGLADPSAIKTASPGTRPVAARRPLNARVPGLRSREPQQRGPVNAFQLVAHGQPGRFELREVPEPRPGPDEVIVRVRACGLNHLDLWLEEDGHCRSRSPCPAPRDRRLRARWERSGRPCLAGIRGTGWPSSPTCSAASASSERGEETLCLDARFWGCNATAGFPGRCGSGPGEWCGCRTASTSPRPRP